MLNELTLDDVNNAVKRYVQADNLTIAMVTSDAAGMKKALASDEPSPMDYGNKKKSDEILAEDKEIERWPLKLPEANITIVPVKEMFAGSAKTNG
jgi:zinc protease